MGITKPSSRLPISLDLQDLSSGDLPMLFKFPRECTLRLYTTTQPDISLISPTPSSPEATIQLVPQNNVSSLLYPSIIKLYGTGGFMTRVYTSFKPSSSSNEPIIVVGWHASTATSDAGTTPSFIKF